ncbi:MAG: class I SAM-dependent methyltransferase [Gammaproteobacteria bacterium]|nr:class I SAM-dependent methyltransferase [Gammaproteobacteria bacterium]
MLTANKPYSESCVQNCEPILSVIKPILIQYKRLLEIGSGTGQHAVYFAPELAELIWQPSDVKENLSGIQMWLDESSAENILAPIELNVTQQQWPQEHYDVVFSANSLHIMGWSEVEAFFSGIGQVLQSGGSLLVYGPFNYNGQFTSESNARFDVWLKQRDAKSGVRDFEAIDQLANKVGLKLENDYAMPANNRILHWVKQS